MGQTLLYEETFPYPGSSGDVSISTAGWTNLVPNNPQRLFQLSGSDGAVYAYQASGDVPVTTAFYTTTARDQGASGTPFFRHRPLAGRRIALQRGHPADLHAGFYDGAFRGPDERGQLVLRGEFVAGADGAIIRLLELHADVQSRRPATESADHERLETPPSGITATSNLAGTITGAGMVFRHTVHGGTHDFDNFRIYADSVQLAISPAVQQPGCALWAGGPAIRLQQASDLSGPRFGGTSPTRWVSRRPRCRRRGASAVPSLDGGFAREQLHQSGPQLGV